MNLKTLTIIFASLSLFACGFNIKPSGNGSRNRAPSPQLANEMIAKGDISQAAQIYAQLAADELDPAKKTDYQLTATELYFDGELYADATRMYATLPLPPSQQQISPRLQVLQAYNTLATGDYAGAITQLPPTRTLTDNIVKIRSLELQSRSYQLQNDPVRSLKARILLDSSLSQPAAITANRSRITQLLAAQDIAGLRQMAQSPGGSVYRGWLEYSALERRQGSVSPEEFQQKRNAWAARYPEHPANAIIVADNNQPGMAPTGITANQVALLLPLTGDYSEIGKSIKTGFLAERFSQGGTSNIKLYNTASDTATAIRQYDTAVSDGASMVIGPLDKNAVINLAATNRINTPTLSLNYLGNDMPGNANLFQFGLLPEDEARDAANFALQQGHRKALVIASEGQIGQRLAGAFEQQFTDAGGTVLGVDFIAEDSYDYSKQLTKILDISSSYARKRRIEKLLDQSIEFEPAIRGDIDIIFMPVDSEQAILLRPQLQFHRAGKVPLISTAQIYVGEPDAERDGDLTGIQYNDIPWKLTEAPANSRLYASVSRVNADGIPKLAALGIDAYRLLTQLGNMRTDPTFAVSGATGELSLAEGNRVRRRLEWAEFQEGIPVRISDALPIETALPTSFGRFQQ